MKKILSLCCMCLLHQALTAQSIGTKTLNSSGNAAANGNLILEWSIGEMTAITTLNGADHFLTQGLLQPDGVIAAPLPVELLYFTGKMIQGKAELEWKTQQEINASFFDVERSGNGTSYHPLGRLPAAGTTGTTHLYHFTDEQPAIGANYYRLKQTDKDGQLVYSPVVLLYFSSTVQLYPNPVNEILNIQLPPSAKDRMIEINDAAGRKVKETVLPAGTSRLSINVAAFGSGTYFLTLSDSSGKFSGRFLKW